MALVIYINISITKWDGDIVIHGRNELPTDNNSYGIIAAGGLAGLAMSYKESTIKTVRL